MTYKQDKLAQIFDLEVIKDYGDDEDFFRLKTDQGEVQLRKLPFQIGQPLPDKLNVRIKELGGNTVVQHNMPRYVSEFYADGFSKGKEFEFKVVSRPDGGLGKYILADENGLTFKLDERKSPLSWNQKVKCKFDVLNQSFYTLRRSDSDSLINMFRIHDISKRLKLHQADALAFEREICQLPFMSQAVEEHDSGHASWIFTALRAIRANIAKWFSDAVKDERINVREVLMGCRVIALHILEGSAFLRNIRGAERAELQAEITAFIDMLDTYIEANDIISRNNQSKFIDILLRHLKDSGYIYHPNIRFAIMMILFRVSPELVNSSLGNIFDTLMGWDVDTWRTEPFRQAFVDQLEIFISEAREEINEFLSPETADDNEKIEKTLTAIAIQQSLANETDAVDLRLNMSFFYRCLALLRRAKADTLLHKSYLALNGVALPTDFTWPDIKETTMMMTRAAVNPPATAVMPDTPRYFANGKVELEISSGGISLSRTDEDGPKQVINGMLTWPGLQVYAHIPHPLTRTRMRTIDGHAQFWIEAESALFDERETESDTTMAKRAVDVDDVVLIEIDRVISSGYDNMRTEAFHCRIVDDHFNPGEGIMAASDLVTYNLHGITVGTFRNDKGEPMQFEARVKDIDENDTIHFSLLESVQMHIRDLVKVDDECRVVVTKDNGYGRDYSAISEKGYGLYVRKGASESMPYRAGNILLVKIDSVENNHSIYSSVKEGPLDGQQLTNALMLKNILRAIAVENDDVIEDDDLEEDEKISAADIREIIQLLRYKAVAGAKDNLDAFDYLSYARLLARLIGDRHLMTVLKAHKDILMLHQSYAVNQRLYTEDIQNAVAIAPESPLIQRLGAKLAVVSYLGKPEYNTMLWDVKNNSLVDEQKALAQMVLSYNLLCEANAEEQMGAAIKTSIGKMLNVTSEQRNLKYYGSESQYVEFKSSLVYPAQKGRSGISAADPDKQEYEILHIVAGFLNTTGGTLYIGVSDEHYERGLEEDFNFYRLDTSSRNTMFRRNIRSLDNMANHLQNLIDKSFSIGSNAGSYATASIDEEASKGVIMVKVVPCPMPVYFDGKIFVRHSAKTTPLLDKSEIAQFIKDRDMVYRMQQSSQNAPIIEEEQKDSNAPADSPLPAQAPVSVPSSEQKASAQQPEAAQEQEVEHLPADDKLRTSRVRKNVLHEYEDPENFATPSLYVRFVGDHDYILTNDEWCLDPENDRLDLTILDEEMDQYLLLIYEGECAAKVPMRELMQKEMNTSHAHNGDHKLLFAVPVSERDAIYSIHTNSRGSIYERLTPVESIPTSSMGSSPLRLMEPEVQTSDLWELVPAAKVAEFDNIKSTNLRRNVIGALAKGEGAAKVTVAGSVKAFYRHFAM